MGLPAEGTRALGLKGEAFDHREAWRHKRARRALEGQRWEAEVEAEAEKESEALTSVKGFILKAGSTAGTQACGGK